MSRVWGRFSSFALRSSRLKRATQGCVLRDLPVPFDRPGRAPTSVLCSVFQENVHHDPQRRMLRVSPRAGWAGAPSEQDTKGRVLFFSEEARMAANEFAGCLALVGPVVGPGLAINMKAPSQHRKHLGDKAEGAERDGSAGRRSHSPAALSGGGVDEGRNTPGGSQQSWIDRISGDLLFLI